VKQNILFIINNLHCGGAENALVALLEEIDHTQYTIDLLLFKQEGFLLNKVNANVTILPSPVEFSYFDGPIQSGLWRSIKNLRFDVFFARLYAVYLLRKGKTRAEKEQLLWKALTICLPKLPKRYDASISYLQNTPNTYNIDKVNAAKKIGFIRTDYDHMGVNFDLDYQYFKQFDAVLSVSKTGENQLRTAFPDLADKFFTMESVFSYTMLQKMAEEEVDFPKGELTLVSVGRLHPVKGFDLAIEACKIIKEHGIDIKWYVMGEGAEQQNLSQLVAQLQLEANFIFLGLKENPHPYVSRADMYVQTSRFEGKSRAIEEAKIHKKPIVVTNYPSVNDQITHRENGYVVEMNANAIAEGILNLYRDVELKDKLISNLQHTKNSNEQQLTVLYHLID
jgi:glycosyltransferase involved in cell wall biosynthesis